MRVVQRLARATLMIGMAASSGCGDRRPSADSAAVWYEIARTPGIVAYFDTARVERLGNGHARIWFRFQYLQPFVPGRDTSVRFEASETRQDLDCNARRTRGLELRMEAAGGVAVGVPTPDTAWSSIDTHPLNSGVFLVACRAIGHPIPPRGGA
jgi:hypothetical protein